MEAGGAGRGDADGFFHDGTEAALIDVAHGESADAGFPDVGLLHLVDVAEAHDDDAAGVHFRGEVEDVGEFAGAVAGDGGERHAVNVAARAGFWRVHVGMSVEPDEADVEWPAAR